LILLLIVLGEENHGITNRLIRRIGRGERVRERSKARINTHTDAMLRVSMRRSNRAVERVERNRYQPVNPQPERGAAMRKIFPEGRRAGVLVVIDAGIA